MSRRSVTTIGMAALSVAVLTTSVAIGAPDDIDDSASASELAVRVDPPETTTTTTAPPTPSVPAGFATELAEVVAIANQERAAAGVGPLTVDPLLNAAAQLHSEDQARMNDLTHIGSDGSNPGQRIARQGYVFRTWGENAAVGYRTAAGVMDGWMGSPGHRGNLLNPSFTEIGMGVAYSSGGTPYWTQVLASPR
ncbi:MAG: CAP domain-containing protein [Actinomycetota bacterium]